MPTMRRTSYTLIVTAQLEASQVELTVLHNRNGSAFFDLTHIHFCVPADSVQPTGQLATLHPGSRS
jgi:hypothetical protein